MDHVFIADTNLFFECKRLEDLPWSDLGADPVVIALTKPVLGEIDKHKKSGGRTRRRAIEISQRVRGMLENQASEEVIREAGPRVLLRLLAIIKPDPDLEQALDYTQNDDRIVGTVAAMAKDQNFPSVTFLSDDGVASSTAHGLGLPFRLIPGSWKRPPEETTEAKRIRELEKDLSTYRAQEPRIALRDAAEGAERSVVRRVPNPLARPDIDRLVETLRARHPMRESFDPPPARTLDDGTEISYEMPDAEAVATYKDETYPGWIARCRSVLETLHERRVENEPALTLTVGLVNGGTRPASRLLISFEARGNISLRRPGEGVNPDEGGEAPASRAVPMPRLPAPPAAPSIREIIRRPALSPGIDISSLSPGFDSASLRVPAAGLRISDLGLRGLGLENLGGVGAAVAQFEGLARLTDAYRLPDSLTQAARLAQEHERLFRPSAMEWAGMRLPEPSFDPALTQSLVPPKHNPEAFYFDDWPPGIVVKTGALTCGLFRHQDQEELFWVEVVFPPEGNTSGAVHCKVQAENLTEPVTLTIPVSRRIEHVDLLAAAEKIVADCG